MRVQLLVGSLRTWLGQKSQALRKIQVEGRDSNISWALDLRVIVVPAWLRPEFLQIIPL